MNWEESGTTCRNLLDATLYPTEKANEWDVNFVYNTSAVLGHLKLDGEYLELTTNYDTWNSDSLELNVKFDLKSGNAYYQRIYQASFGGSQFVSGNLARTTSKK